MAGASAAAEEATDRESIHIELPLIGRLHLPPMDHLAFYAGLGLLAVVEVVDWPVAILLAFGKALTDSRTSDTVREFGDALEHA